MSERRLTSRFGQYEHTEAERWYLEHLGDFDESDWLKSLDERARAKNAGRLVREEGSEPSELEKCWNPESAR